MNDEAPASCPGGPLSNFGIFRIATVPLAGRKPAAPESLAVWRQGAALDGSDGAHIEPMCVPKSCARNVVEVEEPSSGVGKVACASSSAPECLE